MLKRESLAFTVLLSGLVAIPPLSTDIGLPAYAETADALATTQPVVALTLSFFMLGFGIGPLFYGPLSERFGRRPVLLAGLTFYFIASVFCTFTPSIGLLLGSRLVQGFAAAGGTVLAIASIRDLFDSAGGRKKIAYVMMINGLMPMVAPSIGVFVLATGGWRAVYAVMMAGGALLVLGVLFGFAESIPRKNPGALAVGQLIAGYKEVLTHRVSISSALLNASCFGVMFAFISGSPIFFIDLMGVTTKTYGYIFAIPVVGTVSGTLCNSLFGGRRNKPRRFICIGLSLMTVATACLLTLSLTAPSLLVPMVVLLVATNFGIGLVSPNASYAAVQFMPHLAGVASAVLASTQMIVGAVSAALVVSLFTSLGPCALAAVMFGFALLAVCLFLSIPRDLPPEPAARQQKTKSDKTVGRRVEMLT
ncbi:multidrug effflux MFS transporter [Telmatospirillum sp.]|uniref:multidrug effflux MFS transporter n=1 Tax=Telmatospirillum sp. TaxID=2079197 RepID=UPI00283ADF93|nr:multidrug effflux MFS transporter [Telmatospirillum sp.]MDR3436358.1 multidrug effflux MFS transporter [Telmatospirillum sp.]